MSRFGVQSVKESHKKGEVFRLWTAGNFKPEVSHTTPIEGEIVLPKVNENKSLVMDQHLLKDSFQPVQEPDTSISLGNNSGNNESETVAADITKASNCTALDECSSAVLVRCNTQNSDMVQSTGVLAQVPLLESKSVPNSNLPKARSLARVKSQRRRSHPRPSSLVIRASTSLREQRILKILEVCPLICQTYVPVLASCVNCH